MSLCVRMCLSYIGSRRSKSNSQGTLRLPPPPNNSLLPPQHKTHTQPKPFSSVRQHQRKHTEADHLHAFDSPWGSEYRFGEEISILTSTDMLFQRNVTVHWVADHKCVCFCVSSRPVGLTVSKTYHDTVSTGTMVSDCVCVRACMGAYVDE